VRRFRLVADIAPAACGAPSALREDGAPQNFLSTPPALKTRTMPWHNVGGSVHRVHSLLLHSLRFAISVPSPLCDCRVYRLTCRRRRRGGDGAVDIRWRLCGHCRRRSAGDGGKRRHARARAQHAPPARAHCATRSTHARRSGLLPCATYARFGPSRAAAVKRLATGGRGRSRTLTRQHACSFSSCASTLPLLLRLLWAAHAAAHTGGEASLRFLAKALPPLHCRAAPRGAEGVACDSATRRSPVTAAGGVA